MNLTNEAKIWFATKVDNYSVVHIFEGEDYFYKGCNPPKGQPDEEVHINLYNPQKLYTAFGTHAILIASGYTGKVWEE